MDDIGRDKGCRKPYRIAKQIGQEQKDITGARCIKDEKGRLCVDEKEMASVWKRYMEGVMNVENEWDGNVEVEVVEGPTLGIKREEVHAAMKGMKRGKAGGISGVVAEHLKGSGELGIGVMTELCNRMLDGEDMPEDWRSSILVPLYKGKGDVRECGSYRGVKLLEHGMKVMERVMERRLRNSVTIIDMQCGFMPGRGTIDAIFMVRRNL